MSLGINVRGPEGLVFATESRVSLNWQHPNGSVLALSFDSANKLLTFKEPHNLVAAVTYGLAGIGPRTAYSFVPEIEADLPSQRIPTQDFAQRLSDFFMRQWKTIPELKNYTGSPMTFIVGGFNEKEPYGRVYEMHIPSKPEPIELSQFGITWGGQADLVHRLIKGYDANLQQILSQRLPLTEEQVKALPAIIQPLEIIFPLQAMALQDYVDAAILLVRTTIEVQRLTVTIRGCGGPIDAATITRRDGLKYVQQKEVRGERTLE